MTLQAYNFPPISDLETDDTRLFHVITPEIGNHTRIVLLGFPVDDGVRMNGGRTGARFAPNAIRSHLYRWSASHELTAGFLADIGNIDCSGISLETAQERLADRVAELLSKNIFPIVLGGGHETAFGHFKAYAKQNQSVSIINLDAHTDVRDLKNGYGHSGSPFWQAMNHPSKLLESYHVIGAQRFAVAEHHADRVRSYGSIQYRDEAVILPKTLSKTYLSVDLDVLDQSIMPGVSATNPNGLLLHELTDIIEKIMTTNTVTSLDLVELNPLTDLNSMSAKRAAYLVYFVINLLLQRARI
jgi:formiminoglutamase